MNAMPFKPCPPAPVSISVRLGVDALCHRSPPIVPPPQIKLKNLIIACFIPPDYQDKIMQHCHWQDYEGAWNIDFLPYAGEGRRGGRAAVGWATCAEQPQGDDGAACSDGTLDDGVLRGRK